MKKYKEFLYPESLEDIYTLSEVSKRGCYLPVVTIVKESVPIMKLSTQISIENVANGITSMEEVIKESIKLIDNYTDACKKHNS